MDGSLHPLRPSRGASLAIGLVLLAAGCGGEGSTDDGGDGRTVADVRSCLEQAGFATSDLDGGTVEFDDGVRGTHAPDDEPGSITFAAAGHAVSADAARKYRDKARDVIDDQPDDDAEQLELDAGSDGTYAWSVGGEPGSDQLRDARACVEP